MHEREMEMKAEDYHMSTKPSYDLGCDAHSVCIELYRFRSNLVNRLVACPSAFNLIYLQMRPYLTEVSMP